MIEEAYEGPALFVRTTTEPARRTGDVICWP